MSASESGKTLRNAGIVCLLQEVFFLIARIICLPNEILLGLFVSRRRFFVPLLGFFVSQRSNFVPLLESFISWWNFFVTFPTLIVSWRSSLVLLLELLVSWRRFFIPLLGLSVSSRSYFVPLLGLFISWRRFVFLKELLRSLKHLQNAKQCTHGKKLSKYSIVTLQTHRAFGIMSTVATQPVDKKLMHLRGFNLLSKTTVDTDQKCFKIVNNLKKLNRKFCTYMEST